ncbi:hypothetical protein DENSPDRAFT_593393 [Dentipellis sp. KUC8613]|nr:hypothetical protein DENSPDRAFT_593393 [Dentipellis sp. KUC8613]
MTMIARRTLGFVGLNIVRFISIVSLVLALVVTVRLVSKDVDLIKSAMSKKPSTPPADNSTASAAAAAPSGNPATPDPVASLIAGLLNGMLVSFAAGALLFSEIEWPMKFWDTFFPVLGSGHGLGPLGIFQIFMGAMIIDRVADNLTFVAGMMVLFTGVLNVMLGFLLRGSSKELRSVKSWRARKDAPILPKYRAPVFRASLFQTQDPGAIPYDASDEKAGYGFGMEGEKAAGLNGYVLSTLPETLVRDPSRPTKDNGLPPLDHKPSSRGNRFRSSPRAL